MVTFVQSRAGFVGRKVGLLDEELNAWQIDHLKAMACYSMEELLRSGVELFDEICRLDERWHLEVYCDEVAYDEDTSRVLRSLFQQWHKAAGRTLALYDEIREDYVDRGFDVSIAERLRAYHEQCTGILNPSDEVSPSLADAAIESYLTGQTTEA